MGIKLSSEYFITQAMEKTGMEYFGGQTFEEGLGVLIDVCQASCRLSLK